MAGVMRELGFTRFNNGTQHHLSKVIKKLGISTAHFMGQRSNSGDRHVGGTAKKTAKEVLILLPADKKKSAAQIRRVMIESGVPYVCFDCGGGPDWNGKPLTLQIDHENGQSNDNRPNNVKFRCPNCHSQTPNWGAKNAVARKLRSHV